MSADPAVKPSASASLPIIDISGLQSGDVERRRKVGQALRAACLDKGFFYITNHGIPDALVKSVFAESARFFDQPVAAKMALDKRHSRANRGYEPLGGQRLEAGTPPDLKESFFIGGDEQPSDPRVVAGQFGRGTNQWPEGLPGFRAVMQDYFSHLSRLGVQMYRGLALSLDLEESYFDAFNSDPLNVLRLIHYPPQPANPLPDQRGCGAHTDFGGITLLMQDDVGGLQVWDETHEWIEAPPVPGTFVVNLGDFVSLWTNGKYRSTVHRVINTSGRQRYSVPFFANGAPDFPVSCIPTCIAAGETPKYMATTLAEHLSEMFHKINLP